MGFYEIIIQAGAIGGVAAFLLWQNYQTQKRMATSLEESQKVIVEMARTTTQALNNNNEALNSLSETLKERPCLHKEEAA